MQLSSQQLSAVVAGLRALGRQTAGNEKRIHSRFAIWVPVELAPTIPYADLLPSRFSAMMRDISFGGVGLLQSMVVPDGTEFVIRLPVEPKGLLLTLCQAMHCRMVASGLYAIGTQFVREVDMPYLQALVKAHQEAQRIRKQILS